MLRGSAIGQILQAVQLDDEVGQVKAVCAPRRNGWYPIIWGAFNAAIEYPVSNMMHIETNVAININAI